MSSLFHNRPIEQLTGETDFFNLLPKAESLKAFLENDIDELLKCNMIALYGNWGSGKSTIMSFLKKTLNDYYPIFFEAWKHEKDENLELSLCDKLTEGLSTTESGQWSEFRRKSSLIFKNIGKGIKLNIEPMSGFNIGIDSNPIISGIEKDLEKEKTFSAKNKEFLDEYLKIEEKILKDTNKKAIIVFLDDLDRCDPESVLSLISSIKLFFSYGKKTIFFFGLDKKAVEQSLKIKYKDIVKSEEYLEKIFDLDFQVNESVDISKIVTYFFGKENKEIITDLLISLDFTNPRKIKKLFNKFLLINRFKSIKKFPARIFPNLITNDNGDLLETILTIYILILKDHYPYELNTLQAYDKRIQNYINIVAKAKNIDVLSVRDHFHSILTYKNFKDHHLTALFSNKNHSSGDLRTNYFNKFLILFTPYEIYWNQTRFLELNDNSSELISSFQRDEQTISISIQFCFFLIKYRSKIELTESKYIYSNFFQLIKEF